MTRRGSSQRLTLVAVVCALLCSACGVRYWVCDEPDPTLMRALPRTLSATGLFAASSHAALADGVLAYRPEFELWSDGAVKRRWLWLPPGSRIDSRDMNDWRFPQGTKLWKEFVRDGVRVETRLLTKLGPRAQDWVGAAYLWRPDGDDADLLLEGREDALGTPHDVPAAAQCMGCHGGRPGRVLGFAALQLGRPALPGEVALDALAARGLLSHAPDRRYTLPGDAAQREALGYLHANCGHCHNATRPSHDGARCYDPRSTFDFSLDVQALGTLAQTGVYRTGRPGAFWPGHPERSELVDLMSRRGFGTQMPPLGSEQPDQRGLEVMRRWLVRP